MQQAAPALVPTTLPIENRKSKIENHHKILLALTIFAALLRFTLLSRPTLWFDEVATYVRVSGTFREFLDVHRRDAFVPLHYEMYWALKHLVNLTPTMMRLIPAIAGTLMVPAIYFLARQMVSRKTSLVACAFAATSAYLLNFSRDAKMYMHFWLFCTLCMGSLMWWLRTGKRVAWLAWVASGAAMLGLQLTGFIVVGLMPILLLTRARRAPRRPGAAFFCLNEACVLGLFLLGVAIMSTGAAGHFWGFSRWSDPGREVGENVQFKTYVKDLEIPGISWIQSINRGRDGADMIGQAGSAFLFAFEWPRADEVNRIPPIVMRLMTLAAWIMLTLLVTAIFPWPREWMARDRSAREPWWRAMFWIGMWIVVPTYAFYCASMQRFYSPQKLIASLGSLRGGILITLGVFVIGASVLILFWTMRGKDSAIDLIKSRAIRLAQLLLVVMGIFLVCTILAYVLAQRDSQSVWVPRYIGFIWPALAIGCAALLMRLPTWPLRWVAVGVFVAINLVHFGARMIYHVEPRVDIVAADVWAANDPRGTLRTYSNIPDGRPVPGGASITSFVGKYYLSLVSGKRITPNAMRTLGETDEVAQIRIPSPFFVNSDLARYKQINRLIVWDQIDKSRTERTDTFAQRLPAGWKLAHDDRYDTWERWTWQYLHTLRRREYVKD